jgi:hypothetical protein
MSVEDAAVAAGEVTSTSEVTTDAAPVTTETPGTSQPQGDKTEPETKPVKKEGGVSRRLRELVAERDHWRDVAKQSVGVRPVQETREEGPPDPQKFSTLQEYIKAQAQFEAKQIVKQDREESRKRESETQSQRRLQEAGSKFEERAQSLREKHPDFDDVAFDEYLPITDAMRDAMLDSEVGPELLYYLGNNLREAARISRLSPYAAAREIGKLEAKLPDLAKPTTGAPAPITPVKPKSAASEGPSEGDDMKDWIKKRRKQVHGR